MPRPTNHEDFKCGVCGKSLVYSILNKGSQTRIKATLKIPPYIDIGPEFRDTNSFGIKAWFCPAGDKYYLVEVQNPKTEFRYSKEFEEKLFNEKKSNADKIIKIIQEGDKKSYMVNFGLSERIRNSALDSIKMILRAKKSKDEYDFSVCIKKKGKGIFDWEYIIIDYYKN